MGIFIADTFGTNALASDKVEVDLISITKMDSSLGFTETPVTNFSGFGCFTVTYPTVNETGPTPQRIFDFVNSNGLPAAPPHIIVVGSNANDQLADGTLIGTIAGIALSPGDFNNPFPAHACVFYDTSDCNGSGRTVDQDGGGSVSFPSDVILYHELSHCFRILNGTIINGQDEVNAEVEENDMRDVKGLAHRDVQSHNGGCGGGSTSCCIIASLATNSPYSKEVNKLRHIRDVILRNSEVGDHFFNKFFYEYYAFSPEVTRLLGHYPYLKEQTKNHFVNPLLMALDFFTYYSNNKGKDLVPFIKEQLKEKRELDTETIKTLNGLISDIDEAGFDSDKIKTSMKSINGLNDLTNYICQDIYKYETIKWSLFEPLKRWLNSAVLIIEDNPHAEEIISQKISGWLSQFPITDIWTELNRLQFKKELKNLDNYFFDTGSKKVFSERLLGKVNNCHPEILEWSKN